jgi:hypothetical protein
MPANNDIAFMLFLIYFVLPPLALYLGYKLLGAKGLIGLIIVLTVLPMIFGNQSSQNNTEEEVPK